MADFERAQRKKEIAEKREKLKRLRAERAARKEAEEKRKSLGNAKAKAKPGSVRKTKAKSKTKKSTPLKKAPAIKPDDNIQDLLSQFKSITEGGDAPSPGDAPASPAPTSASEATSPGSVDQEAGADVNGVTAGAVVPKAKPIELSVAVQTTIEILPKEANTYERGTETDAEEIKLRNGPSPEEEKFNQQTEEQREMIAALEAKLKEAEKEVSDLKKAAEVAEPAKPKELTVEEKATILRSQKFQDFFRRAALHIERALAQPDVTVDYFHEDKSKSSQEEKESITQKCLFRSTRSGSRTVSSVDWCPKHPELVIASYASSTNDAASTQVDESDGLVLLWSLKLATRPEAVFTCQASVLVAKFHPWNSNMILGGTASGQIVIWDTRQKKPTPVVRTRFSKGHIHPVFSLSMVSSVQARESLISISNDGRLCVWNDLLLIEPSLQIVLRAGRKDDISTPAVGFPARDSNHLLLGSDDGPLYEAKIYDETPGIFSHTDEHRGPITAVSFHPATKDTPQEVAQLFLTSSYDWACKLWSTKNMTESMLTFEFARAYVLDVQWSPAHPAVFAMADGAGVLSIWNLNDEIEIPVLTRKFAPNLALGRIRWSADGKQIAVGDSAGNLTIFDVSADIVLPSEEDSMKFYQQIKSSKLVKR